MGNKQKLYIEGRDGTVCIDEIGKTCHYVYAHGRLERKAGYDIVGYSATQGFDFKNDRIENVIAVLPDGEEVESTLFFWHEEPYDDACKRAMERDPVYGCHGLLVASDDTGYLIDARIKFDERRDFI